MEGHYGKRIHFFKFPGIIDELNKLGYTHFITKEQCADCDFKDCINSGIVSLILIGTTIIGTTYK